jgi:pimeloyl-ACP methyl ester carboxylesterase
VSRFTTADGVTIGFDDTGAELPVIVWSHGILMDRSMFGPQLGSLRDRYRCVTWDSRGHGETVSGGSFTYWDCARDLLALLDQLEVTEAVLAGMSQGGFINLRAALLAPGRVRGLVLIDTQAGPELPGVGDSYLHLAQTAHDTGLSDDVADFAASVVLGSDRQLWPEWIAKWRSRAADPQFLEAFRTLVGREDITDRLGEIRHPALVIHGSADAAIPLERARQLADGLPGADGVVVVDGAGHAANLSHPGPVSTAIGAFLAKLDASPVPVAPDTS